MTDQMISASASTDAVRKVIRVGAPVEVAWRVFTEQLAAWWPLTTYKIGPAPAVDAVIEPFVGGRWYERDEDGRTCDWGRVLAWEPPSRLVLSWEISADWQHDPSVQTVVEVRFLAEDPETTRVELEHSHLDGYGPRRDQMRGIFDGEGGWSALLASFGRAVEA
jgi:uncharacterized protein YndB with AHSA1/START domain